MTTGRKISEFTQLDDIADQDILLAVDVSDTTASVSGTTKKVPLSELKENVTSGLNIDNWDTAYSWGDHSLAGYQTDFTETDPVFTAHPAHGITETDIGQWDAAYGWGNHAVQGYLQSIAAQSINALNDVEINSETLATNQVIKWNGTSWVNGTGGGGTTINGLNDVGDVVITEANLANNQFLRYDSSSEVWRNVSFAGITLADLSVTTETPSSSPSLVYDNTSGVFTYTPPTVTSFEVVNDTTPQLGGDLDLNSNDVTGTGDINISGEIKGNYFRFKQNNATVAGTTGNNRDIKVIGGAPFYYDGTAWREFYLIDGSAVTVSPDTDWDNVMIRSTFDTNITDFKYNVTPNRVFSNSAAAPSTAVDSVGQSRVGSGSLRIDSSTYSNARLQYPMISDYSFTGGWTMEAWVLMDGTSFNTSWQSIFTGDGSNGDFALLIKDGGSYTEFGWYNSNNSSHYSPTTISNSDLDDEAAENGWNHIALVKSSIDGKIRLYINGTKSGDDITDNDIVNPDNFNLGGLYANGGGSSYSFDGFLDDVRIAKVSRYTGNFTPPTTQLPVSGSTSQIVITPRVIQGEIDLGTSPTWTGTPGATVSRQSAGNYRVTFSTAFSSVTDYIVVAQPMDQSSASYVQATRATTHVDFLVATQAGAANVDDGSLAVQILKKA